MDKQAAAMCLQFLQRAQLTGAEVPAFMAVSVAVNDIIRGATVVVPAPAA